MYPYLYPAIGGVSYCNYCPIANRSLMESSDSQEIKSMMRGSEGFETDRVDEGSTTAPMHQMPGMGQQMPGMMDKSKMDMTKIKSDTQEIVKMFEQHHPDIIGTLTGLGMSMGQARQYLSTIVEMTLMHHMMHQM